MRLPYRNRQEAGAYLAEHLAAYRDRDDVIVLALPRGGVPVAYEVARALHAPLDVFIVRKIGMPGAEEFAVGAIASGGVRVLDENLIERYGVSRAAIDAVIAAEERELARRERQYRGDRAMPDLAGKTVILVDDGLATGSTMRAAVAALKREGAARIVVGVPVAAPETCELLEREVDDIVCAVTPQPFHAVGLWYADFSQTSDREVHTLLERAAGGPREDRVSEELVVRVPAAGVSLDGNLVVPDDARGVVLFAHGSGSSRHSPRNRYVAAKLREAGLATLLVDLLTPDEERADLVTGHLRFNIGLLARRLVAATDWLARAPETHGLRVGYFGASTGGGAALVAAAERPEVVDAVVSRGGRPDLASVALPLVRAPTLLIVGERDEQVIGLNEQAMARMRAPVRLEIVPRATHLFEEPGALEQVARLARDWLAQHLAPSTTATAGTQATNRSAAPPGRPPTSPDSPL
jgi:putative phosphoribosyl transferase